MDMSSPTEERTRAHARFKAVLSVHNAAIEAFEVLASIPNASDFVAAVTLTRVRADPKYSASEIKSAAMRVLDAIHKERAREYAVIRGSALVEVCGAFEYLVKATFVAQAESDPQKAKELLPTWKRQSDVAGEACPSPIEQWFLIADRLFKKLADSHPQMHERVQAFLLEHTFMPYGQRDAKPVRDLLAGISSNALNEAFLVRNCLVHHGGRVNTKLACATQRNVGASITLSRQDLQPLLEPIRKLAEVLETLSL